MLLGHYGVAFALKRAEPKLSLGSLFLVAQLLDLLWGAFLLLGWEHVRIIPGYSGNTPFEFYDYPISHSLLAAILWSAVAAALYYSWPTRDTTRHWQAAALIAVAVLSHYPLDALVHVPDLPLAGNDSTKIGLGLWNHPAATVAAELLILALGVAVYVAFRSRRHPVRPIRLTFLLLLLIGTYFASQYAPPPPSPEAVGAGAILLILAMAALAAWADRRATPEELAARNLSPR
jgi:hypothetical protein